MVNYINQVGWGNFSYTRPVPTVLILQGRIRALSNGSLLTTGSIEVNITDTLVPAVVWSNTFNNTVYDGVFDILLGGTHDLSLIPKRKYKRDMTLCNGPVVDTSLYLCDTFTTYFIA